MKRCIGLIVCGFASVVVHATAMSDLLSQSGRAYREQTYSGIITYEFGANMSVLKVTHGVYQGQEFERLVSTHGKPFEVTRAGHDVDCIHPGEASLTGISLLPKAMVGFANNSHAFTLQHYVVRFLGEDRIASRPVNVVAVDPLDKYRYGYTLHLDKKTNLVLKRVTQNHDGRVLERIQFVDINYLNQLPAELIQHVQSSDQVKHSVHSDQHLKVTGNLKPIPKVAADWLPAGFVATQTKHKANTYHASFSDGLASISVILEPVNDNTRALKTSGRALSGATASYSRPLQFGNNLYTATVLGEAPMMTVAKISRYLSVELP